MGTTDEVILVINPGSASRKYALYRGDERLLQGSFERLPGEAYAVTYVQGNGETTASVSAAEYEAATRTFVDHALEQGVLGDASEIGRIGLRIVAPGRAFQRDRVIDAAALEELREAEERAPLHVRPVLQELERLPQWLPEARVIGVSDSAFHKTLPDRASRYAIPRVDAERWEVHRFGYHGISLRSICRQLQESGLLKPRTIVCHLGSGSSVTALREGTSIDTSMGFTPLEGLEMATRDGDLDSGAVIYLQEKLGYTPAQMIEYLNTRSGLLGASGESADMRDLLANAETGDEAASQAVELYVYRIQKYIGAYAVALGGLDLLVFSGTIGERSPEIRGMVCGGFGAFGVALDQEAPNDHGVISTEGSAVTVAVVRTDEVAEIARQAQSV